jgi:hypothetical protein
MNEHGLGAVVVICGTILIVLFAGTPDLHDALLAWLRK